jgi:hypothetical protein
MKIPKLPSARTVSTKLLKSVWKKVSDKPFPDVYGFTFDEKDFAFMMNLLGNNPFVVDTRVEEYGLDFDNEFIEACTFVFQDNFIILIKQSADLAKSLEHELRHVSEGNFAV